MGPYCACWPHSAAGERLDGGSGTLEAWIGPWLAGERLDDGLQSQIGF